MPYESQFAETINVRGHQGERIDAYFARPTGAGPFPGVVIIHHMPGWDGPQKEIARRFAHHGYATVLPNLHFREGKATPEENSASIRAAGGMPDDRTMGDVQAAIDYLRELPYHNGRIGVIGYCSGGRQAYLAGCTLKGIDAVICCYGGGVVQKPEEITDRQPVAPITLTRNLQCPILLFFGAEDKRPSPDDAKKTEAALKEHGKTYESHMYENAGHAFFAVDREQYRVHAANDGWKKVFAWYEKYLKN
ncbi:MAG TPA: dienelactone hydrolase family protein [Burkholderiales bacterium]|nr:dienelactone hydrolase family protein [Burkholderiales bacterium]